MQATRLHGCQALRMLCFQLWNESHLWTDEISFDNWNSPNRRPSKYFMRDNCIHTTTSWAHGCFLTIVTYGCCFANGQNIITLWMKSLWADEVCSMGGSVSLFWERDGTHATRERGLLPGRHTAERSSFLETVPQGLLQVVSLIVKHSLWSQHNGAPTN
jgi:hypothetical protein